MVPLVPPSPKKELIHGLETIEPRNSKKTIHNEKKNYLRSPPRIGIGQRGSAQEVPNRIRARACALPWPGKKIRKKF
jgi:hypothetical protein